ncbi:MAG: hypothetical protein R3Y54_11325 [Eubacteriales bacterium]
MESSMNVSIFVISLFTLVPIMLFLAELYLCKKKSQVARILPIIVACFIILVGPYAIIISAVMFGIYFTTNHIEKKKQEQQSALDKMSIQDLE